VAQSRPRQRRRSGKLLRWFAGFILLALLAGGASLFFPQDVLTVESGPVKADVLVVLGGSNNADRLRRTAELYHAGAAPRILCSGEGNCEANQAWLAKNGVPVAAVLLENRSRTTRENAQLSIPILRKLGARHIIIVTSWYHSRRACHCFEHYAPDLAFYSRPAYAAGPLPSPWQPQGIRGHVRSEYLKLLGYLVRYGISPV
jgi:uncharacterized SAM-binding protein YcdF (DUF218 family)